MVSDQNNFGGLVVPFMTHQQVRVGENTAYPHYEGAYATFLTLLPTGLASIVLHHTWTQKNQDLSIEVPLQCLEAIRCSCHLEVSKSSEVPLAALLYHSFNGSASYLEPALKRGDLGHLCCMPCFVRLEQSRLASLMLSHVTVEPMKALDYRFYPFCAHCTAQGSWRVRENNPAGAILQSGTIPLAVSVCEDDVIRYQPENWREWAWEVEQEGLLFRGPCTAYTAQTVATSTLSLEVHDPHGLRQTLTVPWLQARPFAPVASALWQAFEPEDETEEEKEV